MRKKLLLGVGLIGAVAIVPASAQVRDACSNATASCRTMNGERWCGFPNETMRRCSSANAQPRHEPRATISRNVPVSRETLIGRARQDCRRQAFDWRSRQVTSDAFVLQAYMAMVANCEAMR